MYVYIYIYICVCVCYGGTVFSVQKNIKCIFPFTETETETDGSLVYPEPNNQTNFCHLCLRAMNMVVPSHCRSCYMTDKGTLAVYVYNTFTKQINFKAEPLFLNLASCMELLFFTLEQYLHKADITFLSSASILKSSANGHFLKVVIDIYSFFTIRKRIKSLANTV